MKRSHQGRAYPAHKLIPKELFHGLTPAQRKLIKKRHVRKYRQFHKGEQDANN